MKLESPRRLHTARDDTILVGGRFYVKDGEIMQSIVHVKTTVENALKELEAHEAQFADRMLPQNICLL